MTSTLAYDPRIEWPFVSILVVVRNGVLHIRRVLNELLNLDYPKEAFEIIVVDGLSDDGTPDLARDFMSHNQGRIRMFCNHKRILASGWNIGLREAKGKVVMRVDVHSQLNLDYLRICVSTLLDLRRHGVPVAATGGRLRMAPAGTGLWSEAIAAAWNSPLATARPSYRSSQEAGFVEELAIAVFLKDTLNEIGLFDERLGRTEDNDLFHRLRKSGYKLYFCPQAKAKYFVRSTIRDLFLQMFGNGYWLLPTILLTDRFVFSFRHFAPFFSLLISLLPIAFGKVGIRISALLLVFYLLAIGVASWLVVEHNNYKNASWLAVSVAAVTMHAGYALGTLYGALSTLIRAIRIILHSD